MSFHPDKNLPDCMMPDGGECCAGHLAVVEDWRRQRVEIERLLALEPVAWRYELAGYINPDGMYSGWETRITERKPNVPPGSIRSLTPLYAGRAQEVNESTNVAGHQS